MPAMSIKHPRRVLRRGFSVDSGMVTNETFDNSGGTTNITGCGTCVRREVKPRGYERRAYSWNHRSSSGNDIISSVHKVR